MNHILYNVCKLNILSCIISKSKGSTNYSWSEYMITGYMTSIFEIFCSVNYTVNTNFKEEFFASIASN